MSRELNAILAIMSRQSNEIEDITIELIHLFDNEYCKLVGEKFLIKKSYKIASEIRDIATELERVAKLLDDMDEED